MTTDPVVAPFDAAEASAAALAAASGVDRHDVAVVLGSGWRGAAGSLGDVVAEFPMERLGGLPPETIEGQGSSVLSVRNGDRRIVVFTGRYHRYEGHHPNVVAHCVRTAIRAGCGVVVLTSASGGLRLGLRPGAPVLIRDHLNLTGCSPLMGPNDDRLGPRFPDMTRAYPERLRLLARTVDPSLEEAVYAGFLGPAFETPSEVEMAAVAGAELVGMSTVLETIAAVHAGAEVLGLSLVTNMAAGLGAAPLTHDEVVAAGITANGRLASLLGGIVGRL